MLLGEIARRREEAVERWPSATVWPSLLRKETL